MATIGQQFKAAREAKGVTEKEAGQATKILSKMICEMEANDFSSMAAPAYAKGFIRMYARYLNLDSDALVQQYVEEQSGGTTDEEVRRAKKTGKKAEKKSGKKTERQEDRATRPAAEWRRRAKDWLGRQAGRVPALAGGVSRISFDDIRVRAAMGAAAFILVVLLVVVANCARRRAVVEHADQGPDALEYLLIDEPLPDLYLVEPGQVERVR